MNKSELIDAVASGAELSKAAASRAVDAFISAIGQSLSSNSAVTLVGFGTFDVSKRSARTGRNPQTGKEIQIPATNTIRFKAGKALKDAVNK